MRYEALATPAVLVDLDILKANQKKLEEIIRGTSMEMYPHYKSHKCTALAKWQLEAGAKGITCAKLSEAKDLYDSGVKTVVIANQVVQPEKLRLLAAMAKDADITVCVDDGANVLSLQNACAEAGSRLKLLVEYEIGMKRCGVESFEEMLSLARLIGEQKNLSFDGIQAYAGNLAHELDPVFRREELLKIDLSMAELKRYLEERGVKVNNICGVSTGSVCDKPRNTVYTQLQTGTYLFMDQSYKRLALPFEQALFIACTVVSVKSDRIMVDCGVKSLSMDQVSPVFVGYEDCELSFSEEHTTIFTRGSGVSVGDTLLCIPGHCCTTLNNFRELHLTEKGEVIRTWPIESSGKAQ